MTKLREFSRQVFGEGYSKWIFLLPSLILLVFFALPLISLIYRSIAPDFFANALSKQAFQALKTESGHKFHHHTCDSCVGNAASVSACSLEI
ncbi:MAG: hypothetical protein IPJ47_19600 [Anaerolineales bacterium]|nr:hypothetical protein [Anaerolineales bacterium]